MSEQLQPSSPEQRLSATEFNDQDELNLHASDERLLSIEAARALIRSTDFARRTEALQAPFERHHLSGMQSRNIMRLRTAAREGNDAPIIPLEVAPTETPRRDDDARAA